MRNPVMVGQRVYLRPFEVEDASMLAARYATEPDTFMERGREMISEIAFEHWIRGLYEKQPTHREVPFAVCLKETDAYIGLVSIEWLDLVNRVGETGSWMHDPDYRGKGYGTEAKHLLLAYCFDRLHLRVLRSRTFETNARSAAALTKQGYRPAGRLAFGDVKDGTFRDTLAFDVTREEWAAARQRNPGTIGAERDAAPSRAGARHSNDRRRIHMKPPFLTGERIYIRSMTMDDKNCAVAWFDSEFPVNAERAEKFLREKIQDTWAARRKYFVIVRTEDDQVVGGIKLKSWDLRAADLTIRTAPHLSFEEADSYKADALRLFIPWVRDEHEYMAQTLEFGADETACVAAAEEMELHYAGRFRGYLNRPDGRVDLLVYQALNLAWEVAHA